MCCRVQRFFSWGLFVVTAFFTSWLHAESDISAEVQVDRSRPVYDFSTLQTVTQINLENISSQTFLPPLTLVIDNVTAPTVTVANPDGFTGTGLPYFDFSAELGDGVFDPAEISGAREIRFDNPDQLRFDFSFIVLGEIAAPANTPPTANAGPDDDGFVGVAVMLDGSASDDADGDSLTFSWQFVSTPAGSSAALLGADTPNPSFTPDVQGDYVLELVVNDGTDDSAPDTVLISVGNRKPIADAGADQTPFVDDTVTLDASGSSDPDGDSLTYHWSLVTTPAGSGAALSDASAVSPTFDIDLFGEYVAQLYVNDGKLDSEIDTVVISTLNSAPVANAGPDQSGLYGAVITLDGSASSDVDGDTLTFNWTFLSRPAGSSAILSDPTAVKPTFSIDATGNYEIALVVNDGSVDSAVDTVIVTTDNSPPVANAGPDQSAFVTDTVTLDGSASSDVDGDSLTYHWSITSRPAGSSAVLSDPNAVNPTFDVDKFGTYVAQLIVNDGQLDSLADTVTIITENTLPVANAGPDQTVFVTDTVFLDGSASTDVDGDSLTYHWSITSRPAGSGAALSDPNAIMPTFDVDLFGTYVVQLIVNDGSGDSAPDTVIIDTDNSVPVANAGMDQSAFVGDTVTLDGSASHDVDGDSLTFKWSITSEPSGGPTTLFNPDTPTPSFDVARPGTYVIQLIVNDGTVDSAPDTVTVTTTNSKPDADAGPDQSAFVGDTVMLDGSASSDPDFDPLSFSWSFTSQPAGSAAVISNPFISNPTFVIDKAGTYVAQLIVNDGALDSDPDTVVVITANSAPTADAGPDQEVAPGDTVTLNGGGSSDPDDDSLTYSWSLDSVPVGSTASLSDASAVSPTFVADLAGVYELSLIVNDGEFNSVADSVRITAKAAGITLQLLDTDLVGVGRSAQLQVTLGNPAPAGGVTVTVTSDDGGILTVQSPGTVFIAEGASSGVVTVNGIDEGVVTVRGNATGYEEGVLDVGVTLNLISVPTSLNIPLGQTVSFPVTIAPDPAPPGGVLITLVSGNPGVAELVVGTVMIPEGAVSANAQIHGNTTGLTSVNASHPNYAADTGEAAVTAELNITQNSVSFAQGFPKEITIQLESGGQAVAAPAAISVAISSDNPECAVATSPVTITAGFVSTTATVSYGGSASLSCAAVLTASAPSIVSDTVNVTVDPAPGISISGPITVGSGLQAGFYHARLGVSNHDGVTVRIQSNDPSLALVSPNSTTGGTEYIDVFVPKGQIQANFFVQGLEGVIGDTTFTASAPGFNDGSVDVVVVQPALDISGLIANTTTLSTDDPFRVRIGVPGPGNGYIVAYQNVRAGGSTLTVSVSSSDVDVAEVLNSGASGALVTTEIPPGQYLSPSTVAAGGVALDPKGAGSTVVNASIPGFITTSNGTRTVNVSAPDISVTEVTVGAGLQRSQGFTLGATGHGGIIVRVQSSDPTKLLIAPDANTAGSEYIDFNLTDGQSHRSYVVQGLESTTGDVPVIVTAPGFNDGAATVHVVQPALDISSLNTNTTTLTANDVFQVRIGIPNATNNYILAYQTVRAGGPSLNVSVMSDDPVVGQLESAGGTAPIVDVVIASNQYTTPSTVATGGVAFDPLEAGSTVVSASIPGFITTQNGVKTVTVSAPAITVNNVTVGAGLQMNTNVNLGAGGHDGVTVRIQSEDPTRVLIAPDAGTPGHAFIDLFLPAGLTNLPITVQALEGVTGDVTITATAPGFSMGTATAKVVQPALDFSGLLASNTTLSPDDVFRVRVGVPNAANTYIVAYQNVRAGALPLDVTITSTEPLFGQLVTLAATGSPVTVTIQPGSYITPSTVAAGGVALDPLTSGTTTVTGSATGYITTANASVDVEISAPGIEVVDRTLGSGLQAGPFNAVLGASAHGDVTVRIESSNPSAVLVAPDQFTAGTAFIEKLVPDGQTHVTYVIQALEGVTGSVTLTVSASGFIDGTGTVTVVQPALEISGLLANSNTSAADDVFKVRIGIPGPNDSYLVAYQRVRIGGGTLEATVTNSDAAVGQLVTGDGTGQTRVVEIPAGGFETPATVGAGGIAFDALGAGMTDVEASIPGFITAGTGSATVTVAEAPGKASSDLLIAEASNDDEGGKRSGGGALSGLALLTIATVGLGRLRRRARPASRRCA